MSRILTHLDEEVATAIAGFFQNPREGWWWVSDDGTVSLEGVVNPSEPPVVQMTDTTGCVVE